MTVLASPEYLKKKVVRASEVSTLNAGSPHNVCGSQRDTWQQTVKEKHCAGPKEKSAHLTP